MVRLHKINLYSYFLFKEKNIFSHLQFMFMIKSNHKQYFLSFLGINNISFKTVSTGKLLKKKKLTTKSLKTSLKANKYLLLLKFAQNQTYMYCRHFRPAFFLHDRVHPPRPIASARLSCVMPSAV